MFFITNARHFYCCWLVFLFFKIDPLTRDCLGGLPSPHAFRASRYEIAVAARNASTLSALTKVPRKARCEP